MDNFAQNNNKYLKSKEQRSTEERIDRFFNYYSIFVLLYTLIINNQMNLGLSLIAVILSIPYIFFPDKMIPMLFTCTINGSLMVAFQGISMARIYTLIFIVGSFVQVLVKGKKIISKDILLYLFFIVYIAISSATGYHGAMDKFTAFALNILMVFFILYCETNSLRLIKSLFFITAILTVYYFIALNSSVAIDFVYGRLSINDSVNENELAMGIAQLGAFNFAFALYTKKRWFRISAYVLLILNMISIFLTGSRSALIGAMFGIIFALALYMFGGDKNVRKKNVFTFIGIAVALLAILIFFNTSDLEVMQRFTVENVSESGGTGRFEIWGIILSDVFPKYPLFGLGYGGLNLSKYLGDTAGIHHGAHNIFFSMLGEMGIVGTAIFLGYIIFVGVRLIRNYKHCAEVLIPFAMLCTIVFNGVGENTFGTRIIWFAIALGLTICVKPMQASNKLKSSYLKEDESENKTDE